MAKDVSSAALLMGADLENHKISATELGNVASILVQAKEGDFWEAAKRDAMARQKSTDEYLGFMKKKLNDFRKSSHAAD